MCHGSCECHVPDLSTGHWSASGRKGLAGWGLVGECVVVQKHISPAPGPRPGVLYRTARSGLRTRDGRIAVRYLVVAKVDI